LWPTKADERGFVKKSWVSFIIYRLEPEMSQAHLDHILAQLNAAQGNPQALTLATLNIVLEARGPQLRPLIEAAAIPHWFDRDILTALLPEHTISEETFAALTALPMVEPFQGKGWNVHESTRLALRHWLAAEHPERLRQLSAHAADHFHPQPDAEVETLYHRLLADPEHAARQVGDACYTFQKHGRQTELDRLGLVLAELLTLPQLPAAAEARACLHVVEIRDAYLTAEECQGLAQRALSLFQTQEVADGEAHAWCALGDAALALGQLREAEQAYQQTKRILHDQLLVTQPDSPRWMRDLAVAHSRLGDVRMAQGQLDAAAQAFSEDHAIFARLVALDPVNTNWPRELAVAHGKLGNVHMAQGQLDAAAQAFSESMAISTRLVALDPANTGWLRGLAVAHGKLGDVRMAQGQLDAAAQAFSESLAIKTRLVTLDPANSSWQYDLAIALAKLGQCNVHMRKPKAGVLLLRKAESQLSQLVRQSPDHAQWRKNLQSVRQVLRQFSSSPGKPKSKPKRR
jgi:tetratricopeptide (TPR) repeat protein